MSYLVANPEDRFSRDEAYIVIMLSRIPRERERAGKNRKDVKKKIKQPVSTCCKHRDLFSYKYEEKIFIVMHKLSHLNTLILEYYIFCFSFRARNSDQFFINR